MRDTRKTTPGLRALEKYAVRCGGGVNHRMGLFDMALVKDNHVAAAGGVAEAYRLVKDLASTIPVEIEVDSLDGLREAIEAGADQVLIDNFKPDQMREAVALRNELNRAVTRRGERWPDDRDARASSAPPASTTSPSGNSRTRRGSSTSVSTWPETPVPRREQTGSCRI